MTVVLTEDQFQRVSAWADRLESGKDKQATGRLCDIDWYADTGEIASIGFCCLGIVSEQAVEAGVVVRHNDGSYGEFEDESTLPAEVIDWIGLDENPCLQIPEHLRDKIDEDERELSTTAVALNDDYGFTFPEIAECIRYTFGIEKKAV